MVLGLATALEGFGDGSITTWEFLSSGERAEENSAFFTALLIQASWLAASLQSAILKRWLASWSDR